MAVVNILPVLAVGTIGAIALGSGAPASAASLDMSPDYVPTVDYGMDNSGSPIVYSSGSYNPAIDYQISDSFSTDYRASNLVAFLTLVRLGESGDNYQALVGGGEFGSFADHPANLGWPGIRRKDDNRLTTAAGGYQITLTTWESLGGIRKYGNFSPASQDIAAVDLTVRRGAYDFICSGNIDAASSKLQAEWEFFKSWKMSKVRDIFTQSGGVIV